MNKGTNVLKTSLNHLREESTDNLATMAHLGIDLAESKNMELAKMCNGKVEMCGDEETREAIHAVGKVVSIGVAAIFSELARRVAKDSADKRAARVLDELGAHAMHHTMRKLSEMLGKPGFGGLGDKLPGDNKRPEDFHVDLSKLGGRFSKPSDN